MRILVLQTRIFKKLLTRNFIFDRNKFPEDCDFVGLIRFYFKLFCEIVDHINCRFSRNIVNILSANIY